jgi:MoaA/NifB/PqqE/SkfB family radical SAM enzyme
VRDEGGFAGVWRGSPLFEHLREWQVGGTCQTCNAYDVCHGGCMAVKHFTGRSVDAPDPDCVFGNDEQPAGGTFVPLQMGKGQLSRS